MPVYEFVKGKTVKTVVCSMADIASRTKELEGRGFRRIFTGQNFSVFETYHEALEAESKIIDDPFRGRKVPPRFLEGLENP